jgi:mono/diheme cytochrome c family protein
MCHGVDGKGFAALKTPDFTSPKWQASMTDKQIKDVIKNGKKGTAMVAFGDKLNEEEITAVVAYIRSLKKK